MTTIVPHTPVIIGVDTHKDVHVAVAIDHLGRRLDEREIPTTTTGIISLQQWASGLGQERIWGIEGTSSYGAGLTRRLHAAGERVHEVARPDRKARREQGKSDPIDAEMAARAVLAGTQLGEPKSTDTLTEALRQIRTTRRAAIKARTQATNQVHALLITAPADLRAALDNDASLHTLMTRCARLRPAPHPTSAREACKLALRCTARRWLHLNAEISELTAAMATALTQAAPDLLEVYGVGPDVAAALLITAGGNPARLRSEASFAALCGVSPQPASSGKTRRHRLNRGGDRQANSALHTIALTRMGRDPRTRTYVTRRTGQGLTKLEIMRCLKRYLARELYPTLLKIIQSQDTTT